MFGFGKNGQWVPPGAEEKDPPPRCEWHYVSFTEVEECELEGTVQIDGRRYCKEHGAEVSKNGRQNLGGVSDSPPGWW